jgi:hypothetical protein
MRLISAVSGVQIPAPPPLLFNTALKIPFRVMGGSMENLISLLTLLVFCLGISGNVLAQREVPPPPNNPLMTKPAVSQPVQTIPTPTAKETKTSLKPAQSAQTQPEKVNKNAKPAPAKQVAAKPQEKKSASATKQKNQKTSKVCKTAPKPEPHKVAKAKQETTKTAKKPTQKDVIRATTVPIP